MADPFSLRGALSDVWNELIQRGWFGRNTVPTDSIDRSAGEPSPAGSLGWSVSREDTQPSPDRTWFSRAFEPDVTREPSEPAAKTHDHDLDLER